MQCEAREDYYRTQRGWQDMLEERDHTIKEQKAALEAANSELTKLMAWAKEHGYEK